MSIDKVDGGVADMVRREMETRRTEMLEEEQRARVALDSAAQAAQEIAAENVSLFRIRESTNLLSISTWFEQNDLKFIQIY